jgi:hypothetical protein
MSAEVRSTGAANVSVEAGEGEHPLEDAEQWWKVVRGSGPRSVVEALGEESSERVRRECESFANEHDVGAIATNVIYGVATKAGGGPG